MTNLQRGNAELIVCPACRQPLVPRVNGRPDDLVKCDCTVVSLEWLRLALESLSPQPDTDVVEKMARAMEEVDTRGEPNRLPWQDYAHMATAALNASAPEIQRVREALEEIADPLAAMQRRAEAEGNRLSGMAYSIANDAGYLKQIARAALKQDEENHDK